MKTFVEERTFTDLSGEHTVVISSNPWTVEMWNGEDFGWEVTGKVIAYRDGNPMFSIREPFTETTAYEEYNRWK